MQTQNQNQMQSHNDEMLEDQSQPVSIQTEYKNSNFGDEGSFLQTVIKGDSQKTSLIKKVLVIGAAVFVFLIIGLITVFTNTSGVNQEAERIHAELASGQIEKVYDESLFSKQVSLEEFSAMMGVDSAADLTKAKHVGWTGRGFKNNTKYVYGNFEFPGGNHQVITYEFVDVDGKLILSGIYGGKP